MCVHACCVCMLSVPIYVFYMSDQGSRFNPLKGALQLLMNRYW